jgi:phenylacetate-CoA ligase
LSTQIILKVLALRHRLRQRDRWTRRQLEGHQGRALHRLREHDYARSPFYRRFHKGFTDRPLNELPVLTKEMVMEQFDELVTNPPVRMYNKLRRR